MAKTFSNRRILKMADRGKRLMSLDAWRGQYLDADGAPHYFKELMRYVANNDIDAVKELMARYPETFDENFDGGFFNEKSRRCYFGNKDDRYLTRAASAAAKNYALEIFELLSRQAPYQGWDYYHARKVLLAVPLYNACESGNIEAVRKIIETDEKMREKYDWYLKNLKQKHIFKGFNSALNNGHLDVAVYMMRILSKTTSHDWHFYFDALKIAVGIRRSPSRSIEEILRCVEFFSGLFKPLLMKHNLGKVDIYHELLVSVASGGNIEILQYIFSEYGAGIIKNLWTLHNMVAKVIISSRNSGLLIYLLREYIDKCGGPDTPLTIKGTEYLIRKCFNNAMHLGYYEICDRLYAGGGVDLENAAKSALYNINMGGVAYCIHRGARNFDELRKIVSNVGFLNFTPKERKEIEKRYNSFKAGLYNSRRGIEVSGILYELEGKYGEIEPVKYYNDKITIAQAFKYILEDVECPCEATEIYKEYKMSKLFPDDDDGIDDSFFGTIEREEKEERELFNASDSDKESE